MKIDLTLSLLKRIQQTQAGIAEIKRRYALIEQAVNAELNQARLYGSAPATMNNPFVWRTIKQSRDMINDLQPFIVSTARERSLVIAQAVVDDMIAFNRQVYLPAWLNPQGIPQAVVDRFASGVYFEQQWSLSSAVWGNNQRLINQLLERVGNGIEQQMSAEQLIRMVRNRFRGQMGSAAADYNATRLVKTMYSNVYQRALVEATKDNPFVEGYRWITSGLHTVCPICQERDGRVYTAEELPLDHPNGACTWEPVITRSQEQIMDILGI